ncbi:unnamed protein product, partial [Prorocentrum cordatum]
LPLSPSFLPPPHRPPSHVLAHQVSSGRDICAAAGNFCALPAVLTEGFGDLLIRTGMLPTGRGRLLAGAHGPPPLQESDPERHLRAAPPARRALPAGPGLVGGRAAPGRLGSGEPWWARDATPTPPACCAPTEGGGFASGRTTPAGAALADQDRGSKAVRERQAWPAAPALRAAAGGGAGPRGARREGRRLELEAGDLRGGAAGGAAARPVSGALGATGRGPAAAGLAGSSAVPGRADAGGLRG